MDERRLRQLLKDHRYGLDDGQPFHTFVKCAVCLHSFTRGRKMLDCCLRRGASCGRYSTPSQSGGIAFGRILKLGAVIIRTNLCVTCTFLVGVDQVEPPRAGSALAALIRKCCTQLSKARPCKFVEHTRAGQARITTTTKTSAKPKHMVQTTRVTAPKGRRRPTPGPPTLRGDARSATSRSPCPHFLKTHTNFIPTPCAS